MRWCHRVMVSTCYLRSDSVFLTHEYLGVWILLSTHKVEMEKTSQSGNISHKMSTNAGVKTRLHEDVKHYERFKYSIFLFWSWCIRNHAWMSLGALLVRSLRRAVCNQIATLRLPRYIGYSHSNRDSDESE